MAQSRSTHVRRQDNSDDPNSPDYCPWWYCDETAYIIKWIVVGVIFFLVLAFMLGGYYHAKRRMARGLPPLRYHRWLISRQQRERFFPPQPRPSYGFSRPTYVPGGQGVPQVYPMHNYGYANPPPAYHEGDAVPVYTPPTKVNPDQSFNPPSGPPPGNMYAAAGSSSFNASGPSAPPRVADPANNK